MRYFFIEGSKDLKPMSIVHISGSDSRHIQKVLRMAPGDILGLFDGTGAEYEAKIEEFSSKGVKVIVTRKLQKQVPPKLHLHMAQALLKDRKMDILIRQFTELGVAHVLPFISERSIPRPDAKRLYSRSQRWQKITRESLKQSGRRQVMAIDEVMSIENIFDRAKTSDLKIIFWEDAEPAHQTVVNPGGNTMVEKVFAILGPEGGFSPEEINAAKSAGFLTASLGPRILKAETAAVAACVLLQYLFGDMG